MPDFTDLTRITPVTDAEAARLASPVAFAELASQITAFENTALGNTALENAASPARPGQARPGSRMRRNLLLGAPLTALAAVAAVLILVLGFGVGSGDSAGSEAAVEAMSFTNDHGYTTVIIHNVDAGTSWYNADLARHHLDIKLRLVPVPPEMVGYILPGESSGTGAIKPIVQEGGCLVQGSDCQIGFMVPGNFHGSATMGIGRPARPGEQYQAAGSAFNPGEPLHGLSSQVFGHPLSQVLPVIARQHVTVAQCRDNSATPIPGFSSVDDCDPASMPASWYVYDVTPWAPGQVLLFIQPRPAEPPTVWAFDYGQPLYGLQGKVIGRRAGDDLPLFQQRHLTVTMCVAEHPGNAGNTLCDPSRIPATWYVHAVETHVGDSRLIIFIGQTPTSDRGY